MKKIIEKTMRQCCLGMPLFLWVFLIGSAVLLLMVFNANVKLGGGGKEWGFTFETSPVIRARQSTNAASEK